MMNRVDYPVKPAILNSARANDVATPLGAIRTGFLTAVVAVAACCAFAPQAYAQTTGQGQCPGVISWVHASKVATLLNEDTGLPEFNPKKHLNQVTYVGRFVLVPQVGVVAGLPNRPPVLISGLDAPNVRVATRVHEVEWRMINTAHTPLRLKIVSQSASGAPRSVVDCQLSAPREKTGSPKRFAYLNLFWKPEPKGRYQYQVSVAKQDVKGRIERVDVGLRYGQ
jgi:hypothetical protein